MVPFGRRHVAAESTACRLAHPDLQEQSNEAVPHRRVRRCASPSRLPPPPRPRATLTADHPAKACYGDRRAGQLARHGLHPGRHRRLHARRRRCVDADPPITDALGDVHGQRSTLGQCNETGVEQRSYAATDRTNPALTAALALHGQRARREHPARWTAAPSRPRAHHGRRLHRRQDALGRTSSSRAGSSATSRIGALKRRLLANLTDEEAAVRRAIRPSAGTSSTSTPAAAFQPGRPGSALYQRISFTRVPDRSTTSTRVAPATASADRLSRAPDTAGVKRWRARRALLAGAWRRSARPRRRPPDTGRPARTRPRAASAPACPRAASGSRA